MSAIRAAVPKDAGSLVALMREFYAEEGLAFDPARAERAARDLLGDPAAGRAWLLEPDGTPEGYAVLTFGFSLEFGGRFGLLDEIFVRPARRGAGAGSALLTAVESACREGGLWALRLEIEGRNAAARRFYEARGFRAHDRGLMTRWLRT